jgi:hypothetical protein
LIAQQVVQSGLITVSFAVWENCINDLILNVALKTIYIYKKGGSLVPLNLTLNIAVIDIRLIKAGCNHYGPQ